MGGGGVGKEEGEVNDYSKWRSEVFYLQYFVVNPCADDQILDWSKLKQIADDILKCI